jgi:hypothetical protein
MGAGMTENARRSSASSKTPWLLLRFTNVAILTDDEVCASFL